jgi:hypothetical protein
MVAQCDQQILDVSVIRRRNNELASRPQNIERRSGELSWRIEVLDDLRADNEIERGFTEPVERNLVHSHKFEPTVGKVLTSQSNPRLAEIDTDDVTAVAFESTAKHAGPAPYIEHSGTRLQGRCKFENSVRQPRVHMARGACLEAVILIVTFLHG